MAPRLVRLFQRPSEFGGYGERLALPDRALGDDCPHRTVGCADAAAVTNALEDGQLALGFDAVFSIGTTSVFPYIAEPILDARRRGALTVEINPGASEVSHIVDYRLRAGAAEAMNAVVQAFDRA